MADQRVAAPAAAERLDPTPGGRRGLPARSILRAGRFTPYFFLAPYLVLFSTFVIAPAIYGVWISLHDWDFLLPGKPFVGLRNYLDLWDPASATSEFFWQSMQATGIFTLFSVPPLLVLPLGVALLLNRSFPGRTFFRAVYFMPFVLGVAVVGVLWRFLLEANIGLVNYLIGAVDRTVLRPVRGVSDIFSFLALPDDTAWLTSLPWAWVSLVGLTVWWTLGLNAVIYLAGLQDISRELYDAAKVDGANRWREFWHVTLPGLRSVLVFVVTITILASANMFGQSYLVTRGNPGNETRTAIMYIAEQGLRDYKMGSAAAMGYILALALALISILNFRLLRYKE